MNTIVVPVNFSPCAENAARYACDLAGAIGAEVHLVHVIEVPVTSAEMLMTEAIYAEMVDAAHTSMGRLREELSARSHAKVPIRLHIETGFVFRRVSGLCKELNPYTVVVGSSGSSLEKLFVGSPISSLLQLPYPVLVVPMGTTFRQPRRVLLACAAEDIESGIPQSLPLLERLRDQFNATFKIVSVATWPSSVQDEDSLRVEAWRNSLREISPEVHLLPKTRIEEALMQFLASHPADLVVVFPKSHALFSFHVSQSRKIALNSPVPVMSLHE